MVARDLIINSTVKYVTIIRQIPTRPIYVLNYVDVSQCEQVGTGKPLSVSTIIYQVSTITKLYHSRWH